MGTPEIHRGLFPMMIMANIFRNVPRRKGLEFILMVSALWPKKQPNWASSLGRFPAMNWTHTCINRPDLSGPSAAGGQTWSRSLLQTVRHGFCRCTPLSERDADEVSGHRRCAKGIDGVSVKAKARLAQRGVDDDEKKIRLSRSI